jgi:hypothetical protein
MQVGRVLDLCLRPIHTAFTRQQPTSTHRFVRLQLLPTLKAATNPTCMRARTAQNNLCASRNMLAV